MAFFYLMPSRSTVGERFAVLLHEWFPGQAWDLQHPAELAERLAEGVQKRDDTFVVFQEDLADDLPIERVLQRDFGADVGDDVIDVRLGSHLLDTQSHHWRIGLRRAA